MQRSLLVLRTGLALFVMLTSTALSDEPSRVFEYRPESGIPREASSQKYTDHESHGTLAQLANPIKNVRTRYYDKGIWASEKQVNDYVAGLLASKGTETYAFQVWSQVVGMPEVECLIEFTEDVRHKQGNRYSEGRLLLWRELACFRDASGRWWFVTAYDHFHAHHPAGSQALQREEEITRGNPVLWGEQSGGLELGCALDAAKAVLRCQVRNAATNAISCNDFYFGYIENVRLEIREGTEWKPLPTIPFPGLGAMSSAGALAGQLQSLPGATVITNTWSRRLHSRGQYFKGHSLLSRSERYAELQAISASDTFVIDLLTVPWPTNAPVEARVAQLFANPKTKGTPQAFTLYSPVIVLDNPTIESFQSRAGQPHK